MDCGFLIFKKDNLTDVIKSGEANIGTFLSKMKRRNKLDNNNFRKY